MAQITKEQEQKLAKIKAWYKEEDSALCDAINQSEGSYTPSDREVQELERTKFLLSLIDSAPPELKGFEWKRRAPYNYQLMCNDTILGSANPTGEQNTFECLTAFGGQTECIGLDVAKSWLESTVRSELQSLFTTPPKAETGDVGEIDFGGEAYNLVKRIDLDDIDRALADNSDNKITLFLMDFATRIRSGQRKGYDSEKFEELVRAGKEEQKDEPLDLHGLK